MITNERAVNIVVKPVKRNPKKKRAQISGSSSYSVAAGLRYPYIRGDGKLASNGVTWLSRFTKTADGRGPALYVGWDDQKKKWVIEKHNPGTRATASARARAIRDARSRASQRRSNVQEFVIEYKDNRGNWGAMKRVYKSIASAMIGARALEKKHPNWIVQVAEKSERYDTARFIADKKQNPREKKAPAPPPPRTLQRHEEILAMMKPGKIKTEYEHEIIAMRRAARNPSDPVHMLALESIHYVNTGTGAQFLRNAIAKAEKYRDTLSGKARNEATKLIILARRELRKKPAKRNPSARELSERFQGRSTGRTVELKASTRAPDDLALAGRLVFLKLVGAKTLKIPGAVVGVSPKTERLWIVGDRAPLLKPKARAGEALDFGEIDRICYETAKKHIGNGKRSEYVHTFGENGGRKPRLQVDADGMPIIVGGDYKIRAEGIIN